MCDVTFLRHTDLFVWSSSCIVALKLVLLECTLVWGVRHGTISFLWSGYLLCVSGRRGVLQEIGAQGPTAISNGLLVGRASLSPVITACQRPGVWLRLYRRTQATADSHWTKDQKASFWAPLITQLYFTKRTSVCAETPQKRHCLTLLKYTIIGD